MKKAFLSFSGSPNVVRLLSTAVASILLIIYAAVDGKGNDVVIGEHSDTIKHRRLAADGSGAGTNPYIGGCLREELGLERFPNRRVCNSDDVGNQNDCFSSSDFTYPEVSKYRLR